MDTREQLQNLEDATGVEISLSEWRMSHRDEPDFETYGRWGFLPADRSTGDDDYLEHIEWRHGTLADAAAALPAGDYHLCP